MAGDVLYAAENDVLGLDLFPAWSDAFYLLGYVFLAAGALHLARTRQAGRDRTAVLDAAIVAVGVAVPAWVFLVEPAAASSELSLAAKLVSSAYPLLDIFLLAVLTRLLTTPGSRTGAFRRVAGALVATLLADAGWNAGVVVVGPDYGSWWTDGLWLAGYVLVAAAACHPSMRSVTEPPPRRPRTPTRSRLAALALASTLPAATLAADGWSDQVVAWQAAAVGSVVLTLLVLSRMAGLLEQVQVQAVQLSALAREDGLTGVPNRRTWDHELSRACAQARDTGEPLAVALLDLDRFKRYNDEHGHQAGDRLLQEAAASWTSELAPHGGLLARYGGEEFAVLLPGLGAHAAAAVLDSLRWATPGHQTFSAGVAVWDPATEPGAAVGAADSALYEAKREGRDRVVVAGDEAAGGLPTWAEAARVVLQPILHATDGRLAGHEASARFPHDQDVRRVFDRAAEEGYGDLLEARLLRRALELPGRPDGSALFVRASQAALSSARFWAEVPEDLSGVVVELDQVRPGAAARDGLSWSEQLELVRRRGAQVAVDHLGAGTGDLGRVLAMRPQVVKLDRALVVGCADDPVRRQLVDLVVRLAESTGARVCAEGVGSAADLGALRAAGVHLVQGPHLGRTAPGWTVVPGWGAVVCAAAPGCSASPVAVTSGVAPAAS